MPRVIRGEWRRSELADWCVMQSGVLGAHVELHTTMCCSCVDFTGEPRVVVDWISAFGASNSIDGWVEMSGGTRCSLSVWDATRSSIGRLHARCRRWSWCRRTTRSSDSWTVNDRGPMRWILSLDNHVGPGATLRTNPGQFCDLWRVDHAASVASTASLPP